MSTRILVIEDDKDIRKNLKRLLESEEYIVDVAENGQEALDFLSLTSSLPDLIVLDLMMPIMDGFQFREQQLENPSLACIPVIIMTAGGQVEEKTQALKAAAGIRKPADILEILNIVRPFAKPDHILPS